MPDAVTAQTSWSVISSDSGGNLYSSMVGLSDHHVEVLIELVRSRPVLWQKSHPDYEDTRRIKANNWEDVNRSLHESGATTTGTAFLT